MTTNLVFPFLVLLKTQLAQFQTKLHACKDEESLKVLKHAVLKRTGVVVTAFNRLSIAEKKQFSSAFSDFKTTVQTAVLPKPSQSSLPLHSFPSPAAFLTFSQHAKLPIRPFLGKMYGQSVHPLRAIINLLHQFFQRYHFQFFTVPELTTVTNNFFTLNISKDHPAYDPSSCFFLDETTVLRTHATNFTSQMLQNYHQFAPGPFFAYTLGNVYRNDTDDATHLPKFLQLDGCMWGPNLSLAKLKGFLTKLAEFVFDKTVTVRFRANYFPFTEPSIEMDLKCLNCSSPSCGMCKNSGWIEILGAGIIHENVLINCQVPTDTIVLAFGIGIERLAMLKYQIPDIRDLTYKLWIKDEDYVL